MIEAMGTMNAVLPHPGIREVLQGDLIELPPAELRHIRIGHLIFRAVDAAGTVTTPSLPALAIREIPGD